MATYYQNGVYQPGNDPRPFSALTPQEQAMRSGVSVPPSQAPNPSSLQGTMTSGTAPTVPPPANSTGATLPPPNPNRPSAFALSQVMNAIQGKVSYNNKLMETRQLLLKQLYNEPLTPDERAKLDPTMLAAVDANDRDRIDVNLRLISDEIAGRNNSLDKSVQFLTDGYLQETSRLDNERQQAIDNVLKFANVYGDQARNALTSLYGVDYVNQLAGMGIDIDNLGSMKTLDQINNEKALQMREEEMRKGDTQIVQLDNGNTVLVDKTTGNIIKSLGGAKPTGGGSGLYTEDQLKVITKINQDVSKNATYGKTTSMRGAVDNVVAALAIGNGVSDITAINQFQKVIDEGAVTRDQDVVLIQSAQSLSNTLKTKIKQLEKGDKLSEEQRKQMREVVENIYNSQVQALLKDPYIAAKTREAELYGLTSTDTILGELGGFSNQETNNPGVAEADIKETIVANKTKNREQLINELVPVFPEFSLDEIAKYVYTLIPDQK